ncbi:RusA family crossover junction endodeoxyribonuclease [Leuconostoc mesenteroides]|uniref:RusA family crossover junction endodeoxyribonuclease n=1 Tax=Leuconostoc mesenteroides TaxID=1245 RepID=UPI00207432A9|nr:RusA family crossover junction endodeoxyribonuclease [Leuconostoc mesenteroides]MCM6836091.1 RusA family crossover junction endodeoxyribonuclease [Leuconostoc mesenteroides]
MNEYIELTVNPAPHNQSKTNRWGGVYKSKREIAYINELENKLNNLTNIEHFTDTPIKVSYKFGIKPPKSWSKKKTQQAINQEIYPTSMQVGDVDNIVKSTQDRLMATGVIDDDSNIISLTAEKRYSANAFVVISIERI